MDEITGVRKNGVLYKQKFHNCRTQCFEVNQNATFVEMDLPQSNKQKKTFQFIFVFILKSYLIGYGDVKILVGVQEIGRFLHYSVTIQ